MAPPVVYESENIANALKLPAEERRRIATTIATQEGAIAALKTTAVWGPVIAYLHYGNSGPSRFFKTRMNTSGRTAVAIMPVVFAFGIVSEQVASRLANPGAFSREVAQVHSLLPIHKRVANYIYDHPVRILLMAGIPTVGAIFMYEGTDKSLSFSQRVIHTRVLGQFSVLAILVATMGFTDFMSKRGRYLEPWELDNKKTKED